MFTLGIDFWGVVSAYGSHEAVLSIPGGAQGSYKMPGIKKLGLLRAGKCPPCCLIANMIFGGVEGLGSGRAQGNLWGAGVQT